MGDRKLRLFRTVLCCAALCITTLCYGADWTEPSTTTGKVKWDSQQIKWLGADDPYSEPVIDTTTEGYFFSAEDFLPPENWPAWALRRFNELTSESLDQRIIDQRELWARPHLKSDHKWVGVAGSKVINTVSITAPVGAERFTVMRLEPEDGTIEQDFNGHAKVYNLKGRKRYWVHAWDANDYLGKIDIDCETVRLWVRYPEQDWGPWFYYTAIYQDIHAVKDIIQDEDGYYFGLVNRNRYGGGGAGPNQLLFWTDYVAEWDGQGDLLRLVEISTPKLNFKSTSLAYFDFIHHGGEVWYESGASVFVAACMASIKKYQIPELTEVWSHSWWAQSLCKQQDGSGYIVLGHSNNYGYHHLTKITEGGAGENWGSSGVTANYIPYMYRVEKTTDDDYVIVGGGDGSPPASGAAGDLTDAYGGTADSTTITAGNPAANGFDNNIYNLWESKPGGSPCDIWLRWTFPGVQKYVCNQVRIYSLSNGCGTTPKLQGSNGAGWTDLVTLSGAAGGWVTWTFANSTAYNQYRIYHSGIVYPLCPVPFMSCKEVELIGASAVDLVGGGANIWKVQGATGGTEGDFVWKAAISGVSEFWDCAIDIGNDKIVAVGYGPSGGVFVSVKNDLSGNTVQETFADVGKFTRVAATDDGNFIVVGETHAGTLVSIDSDTDDWTDGDMILKKIAADGSQVWSRKYNAGGGLKEKMRAVTQDADGGYLVGGSLQAWTTTIPDINSRFYFIKTNSQGYSCSDGTACN